MRYFCEVGEFCNVKSIPRGSFTSNLGAGDAAARKANIIETRRRVIGNLEIPSAAKHSVLVSERTDSQGKLSAAEARPFGPGRPNLVTGWHATPSLLLTSKLTPTYDFDRIPPYNIRSYGLPLRRSVC